MYGSSIWAKLALAAAIIGMILFIVGYATVSWMVYQTTTNSVRVGLWNMNSCAGTACSERAVADSFKTGNTSPILYVACRDQLANLNFAPLRHFVPVSVALFFH